MHNHIPVGRICVQNSLSASTQVFQECWSGPPLPSTPPNIPSSFIDTHTGLSLGHGLDFVMMGTVILLSG